MTDPDLDQSYSAVCQAMTRVGPDQTPVFLSMLCLSLISRPDHADQALALIANAEAQCRVPNRAE